MGHAQNWDEIIFDGDVASRNFIAFYIKNNEVHAAAGCKRDKQMAAILQLMRLKQCRRLRKSGQNPLDFAQI